MANWAGNAVAVQMGRKELRSAVEQNPLDLKSKWVP